MSRITFTGGNLFKVSIESGSAGPFCLLRMRTDYSVAAREALDWPALPSGVAMMDLEEAEIPFGKLVFTSQQQNLDGSEPACLSLLFSGADTFRVVRVKGKKNAASFVQLRFNIKSTDPTAAAACFEYKRAVKKGLAELKMIWGNDNAQEIIDELELKAPDAEKPVSAKTLQSIGGGRRQGKSKAAQLAAAAAQAAGMVVVTGGSNDNGTEPSEVHIDEYTSAIDASLGGEAVQ